MLVAVHHKINLGLHVIDKLSSGYHALETVFLPCRNYEDVLEITPSSQFSFTLKNADFLCSTEDNLCVKAYRLLQKSYHLPPVRIVLSKQIPTGSGLGGGSADAAFTLKTLNQLFSLNVPISQLHEIALQVGCDVPFFLHNTPMYATGKGELLEPIALNLSNYTIEVVCPNIAISTAQAYSQITPKKPEYSLKQIIQSPIDTWKEKLHNDFEAVIFNQHSQLRELKKSFYRRGAVYASMSGSGSAVYGIFPDFVT